MQGIAATDASTSLVIGGNSGRKTALHFAEHKIATRRNHSPLTLNSRIGESDKASRADELWHRQAERVAWVNRFDRHHATEKVVSGDLAEPCRGRGLSRRQGRVSAFLLVIIRKPRPRMLPTPPPPLSALEPPATPAKPAQAAAQNEHHQKKGPQTELEPARLATRWLVRHAAPVGECLSVGPLSRAAGSAASQGRRPFEYKADHPFRGAFQRPSPCLRSSRPRWASPADIGRRQA